MPPGTCPETNSQGDALQLEPVLLNASGTVLCVDIAPVIRSDFESFWSKERKISFYDQVKANSHSILMTDPIRYITLNAARSYCTELGGRPLRELEWQSMTAGTTEHHPRIIEGTPPIIEGSQIELISPELVQSNAGAKIIDIAGKTRIVDSDEIVDAGFRCGYPHPGGEDQ
jgi:hypothetical protein